MAVIHRAALFCTHSIWSLSLVECGDQTGAQYSKSGQTRAMYARVLVAFLHPYMERLRMFRMPFALVDITL